MEDCEPEVQRAWGRTELGGGALAFPGKLLGMFLYNACPEPLADPWFPFPPPLARLLLPTPALFRPSIQLPESAAPEAQGGQSVPSRHMGRGQPPS